jgi:hypothetical protein
MNTQKQNAILVRDALGKINGYASHDDNCDILRYSECELPSCSCGYTDAWGAVQQALLAAQALVDGVGEMDAAVKEIKPCPYVNGFTADNKGVSFVLQKYNGYSDFVLFEDGKPNRCFRFATNPTSHERE